MKVVKEPMTAAATRQYALKAHRQRIEIANRMPKQKNAARK